MAIRKGAIRRGEVVEWAWMIDEQTTTLFAEGTTEHKATVVATCKEGGSGSRVRAVVTKLRDGTEVGERREVRGER